jgi:riboflavin transporter FmnP
VEDIPMNRTRRLTLIALLSAVAFVLMIFPQFPLIPGASFLKIDFSIVPVLIGALLLDLKSGYAILLIRSLLKILLQNEGAGDYIGLPMNIVGMAVLLTAIYLFVNRQEAVKFRNYLLGSAIGTVALTITMVVLNYIYAMPLYAIFAGFDISKTIGAGTYLLWMVVPFNLLEGIILSLVAGVVYAALRRFVRATRSTLHENQ